MDELYDDLENYDDVDTVNHLKIENSQLKHKLEECNKSIETLQKDFDKLEAEFKALEASYSSLLKSARAEIQRKTEMITNLNIEKDMLIITAAQKVPANKIQKLVKNVQVEAKRKKKKKRNIVGEGAKDRTELIRRECERPPSSEASSTTIDNSNIMMGNERLMDNTKTRDNNKNIRVIQENDAHKREVFPNHRGNRSPVVDRRVSALARPQFSKLSSDEEFEDLYSALKPKTERDREPERNRKRGRDDSEDSKAFYNNTYDRPLNYPDPFRERFNRNRTGRYSNNDRNMNRDKQYNESNKNMNRDTQYDSNKSDKYDSHYQRYSPERHRRGAKEHPDDRYTQQPDRNRRLLSPPRERHQHRSRERRRSCHDHERQEYKQDVHRYNYPEPHTVRQHIHGEYDEPQNKRPRIDPPYPIDQEDRRLSEKQYFKEMPNANLRDHTCQSPDFSHEESSNEPIPEIRSTASTVLDDPRVTSKKYVISTEGNKEVLQSANANKTYLQPVNKSLWNLQEVQVPNALKHRTSEISEELVEEMEADKPVSIISMESGEVGSETTDTVTDDVSDFQEVNKSNYNYGPCVEKHYRKQPPKKNTPRDIGYKSDQLEKHHKETSLIENTSKGIGYKIDILENHRKEKSPIEKTFKEIGYKRDPLEKHHKEKSSFVNKSKHIGYKSNILEKRREKSPILKVSKDIGHERDGFEKQRKTKSKLVKSEKTNNRSADESETTPPRDNNKVGANKHNEKPSILQRLINSVVDKSPEHNSFVKSSKSKEENDRKETAESMRMEKTDQETLKTVERKEVKKISEPEKENESNVQIVREFQHRVYATRHIVEGDLELSDDSNDDKQLKIDEKKIEVKSKQRVRRKSTRETCKEKPVDAEDTTRKTRSKKDKKDKEDKTTNKFSELFGDSSSLITPEDLNLATRAAHALPAEGCPTEPENTQDGIIESKVSAQTLTSTIMNSLWETKGNSDGSTIKEDKRKTKVKDGIIESTESVQTLTSKVQNSISETKGNSDSSTIKEDKRKSKVTKDTKNSLHKRHKNSDSLSDDTHKTPASKLNEVKKNTETPSLTAGALVLPNETLKHMQNEKITTDTNKNDALNPNEKPKGSVKINKRLKNKDEQRLSEKIEPVDESHTKKTYVMETNSNISLASDNKENSRGNDNWEGNINSTARTFENTGSDVNKVNNEKLPLHDSPKDTIGSTVVQDVPNLAPVVDEPGLVKTVVISTGIQLLDSNSTQYSTAFNALSSSTPAKELSIVNNSSELEPNISHSAQVSVTIERDETVSQSENDAPDIRINYYRRRRKVLKR